LDVCRQRRVELSRSIQCSLFAAINVRDLRRGRLVTLACHYYSRLARKRFGWCHRRNMSSRNGIEMPETVTPDLFLHDMKE
jgi:hypothetical protein